MTQLYITPAELNSDPTLNVPWSTLYPTNVPGAQAALCQKASGVMDNIVGEDVYGPTRPYALRATLDTETADTDTQEQTFIDNHGDLVFEARYRPVLSVLSGSWITLAGSGMSGGSPVAFDLTDVYWEGREIVHIGPFESVRYMPLRVTVTYIDGFANALLTSSATVAATSFVVDDATGIRPGQTLNVYDGASEEVTVSSTFTPFQGAGSVALAFATANAHNSGTRVSAMPGDLQQAALYLVQHFVSLRSPMGVTAARQAVGRGAVVAERVDYKALAAEILENYKIVA